jgi:hypothetical protein
MRIFYLTFLLTLLFVLSGCETTLPRRIDYTLASQRKTGVPNFYLTTYLNIFSYELNQEVFKKQTNICFNVEGYGGETITTQVDDSEGKTLMSSPPYHIPETKNYFKCFTIYKPGQYKIVLKVRGVRKEYKIFTVVD